MADMMDIILAKALSGNDSGGGTGEGDPALVRRVAALEEELDALLDEEGKVKEDCLPELGGSGSGGGSDPRVDELVEEMAAIFDEEGKIKEDYLPELTASDPRVDELMETAAEMFDAMLDENGKISGEMLPVDWVRAQVDAYVGDALGGEY